MRSWRKYWSEMEFEATPSLGQAFRQVGKTALGRPVRLHHLNVIVDVIVSGLALSSHDLVLDLGCGNGVVTERIAVLVERVAGIDVSEALIDSACSHRSRSNCTYHVGDLADLGPFPIKGVTKAYSYEVLQYLSTEETRSLFRILVDLLGEDLEFFAGSIPERAKLRAFYNTSERWRYYERRMTEGIEQIGHWWERDELVALCDEFGLACTLTDQPESLYTSHYRFDAKISRR